MSFDFHKKEYRVAGYLRKFEEDYLFDFDNEKWLYENIHYLYPSFKYIGLYVDKEVSSRSYEHNDELNRLMKNCEDGKIDIIITESPYCFIKNTIDCWDTVRKLWLLPNPVGIIFRRSDWPFTPYLFESPDIFSKFKKEKVKKLI